MNAHSIASTRGFGFTDTSGGRIIDWEGSPLWFNRFCKNPERSGDGLYVGFAKNGKAILLTEREAKRLRERGPT